MLRDGEDVLTNQSTIANLAVGYFTDLFASQSQDQPNNLIKSIIHLIASVVDNYNLTKLPLPEEIKCVVFSLNGEGAPGPNGFGGCFFQEFWDIVGNHPSICAAIVRNQISNMDKPDKLVWVNSIDGELSLKDAYTFIKPLESGVLGCFANYMGIHDSLYAELFLAFFGIKIAYAKGWHVIWLECNSTWVVDFLNGKNKIPWKLSNLWDHCRGLLALMDFKVSHIFREGNTYADKLASFSLNSRVDN
ncbi:hypothetical protein Lal_00010768 [Lupinus albus]|nr:hypothetical protein Lal_00010768 [Lupinus albus]